MATLITLAHQKGGVGKSTLTLNLAYAFNEHVPTAIIDLDPQGTISQLQPLISGIDILMAGDLKEHASLPYTVIFIDTPPYLSSELPDLFKLSDLIIIPTRAGIADLMAIRATIKLLEDTNCKSKAVILLNLIKYRTSLTREIQRELFDYKIGVLNNYVSDRVSYSRSLLEPKGVLSLQDDKAKEEIKKLTEEILNLI